MIYAVTVTNNIGESLRFDLARPDISGLAITSITGIGAGSATINSTDLATSDGSLFNSARLPSRNIVISFKYSPSVSAESARLKTYRYFPIKKKVSLAFETESRTALIDGYVETNDPTIFSNDAGSDISIVCPDPYFYAEDKYGNNRLELSGIMPAFEFPFCANVSAGEMLEFSTISTLTTGVINYKGDSEVGVVVTIHADNPATNISMYNLTTNEELHITTDTITSLTGEAFGTGDDIVISSVRGDKYINLVRSGTKTNILNSLQKGSNWLTLQPGDNVFTYTADTGSQSLYISIAYKIAYEGV